jgi:pimeloyl-ACP methyl ester carboxylesterase
MKYELVRTTTEDNLILTGLLYDAKETETLVIHIHGYMTDFYTWDFPNVIAEEISKTAGLENVSILMAQHRGTGIESEILDKDVDAEAHFIGSNYEKIEESYLDIDAWIEFAKLRGYKSIVLMGHSLGTYKVTRYLFEGKDAKLVKSLILLAPFDKNSYLVENKGKNWEELVSRAKEMIENGHELDMITKEFDDYPMTYRTFYSWYKVYDLNCIWDFYKKSYISPILTQIKIPVKVIYGTEDVFLYMRSLNKVDEVETYLKKNLKDVDVTVLEGSQHCYQGYENQVADEVCKSLIKDN